MEKKEFQKINKFLKKIFEYLASKAFLTFLILIFLISIFSGFLFLGISVKKIKSQAVQFPQFKEELYRKILKEWEKRKEKFEQADLKMYPNPFQK